MKKMKPSSQPQRNSRRVPVSALSPAARQLGTPHRSTKVYAWRRLIFFIALVVTLAFVGKTLLDFFRVEHVTLEVSGNVHYTERAIYDVLGANLDNIVTESEEQAARYLKENLSYIKDARISKRLMKRVLSIEVTEREPFARLQFTAPRQNRVDTQFFLLDREGYVLESILDERSSFDAVMLQAEGDAFPAVGTVVQTPAVVLGLHVLEAVLRGGWTFAKRLEAVDARDAQKIRLHIVGTSARRGGMQAWIAADTIARGLHYIELFLKRESGWADRENGGRQRSRLSTGSGAQADGSRRMPTEQETHTYLDARFEDAIYLGSENR